MHSRIHLYICLLYFCLPLFSCAQTTEQVKTENITNLAAIASAELRADPDSREKWVKLHDMLKVFYQDLTVQERQVYREQLADLVQSPLTSTISSDEPGIRLKISGRISNLNGESVHNAQVTVFSTDSHGYYTPWDSIKKRMNEPDARIMGFLRTDPRGHFEIFTIRPGSYPIPYEGRTIPAHVHLVIKAPGYQKKLLQVVFDDDPVMDDFWRQWAAEQGFPILKLEKSGSEYQSGTLNIILKN